MSQYRIILLGDDGQELSAGYVFSPNDDNACASAERLMSSNPKAVAVLVRKDDQLVCSYQRA
ncbi:MAG TPA: hypothetical protein VIJ94_09795 [Caulobacteraceae bacterium]